MRKREKIKIKIKEAIRLNYYKINVSVQSKDHSKNKLFQFIVHV